MSRKQQVFAAISLKLIRGWVQIYTLGLTRSLRERRLAEIDSDIWEQTRSAEESVSAVFTRYLRGVPDDLLWRVHFTRGDKWVPAVLTVLCMGAGMQVGLLGPRILAAERLHATTPFFQERLPEIIAGHALIVTGLVLFSRLLIRWHKVLRTAGNPRPLTMMFLLSGTAAAVIAASAFSLTLAAGVLGSVDGDPATVRTLYHVAGLMFHVALSGVLAFFLASTVVLLTWQPGLPPWTRTFGLALALALGSEAIGGPAVFLMAQIFFLGWIVVLSLKLVDREALSAEFADREMLDE